MSQDTAGPIRVSTISMEDLHKMGKSTLQLQVLGKSTLQLQVLGEKYTPATSSGEKYTPATSSGGSRFLHTTFQSTPMVVCLLLHQMAENRLDWDVPVQVMSTFFLLKVL